MRSWIAAGGGADKDRPAIEVGEEAGQVGFERAGKGLGIGEGVGEGKEGGRIGVAESVKDDLVVLAVGGEAGHDAGDDGAMEAQGGEQAEPGAIRGGEGLFAGGLGAQGLALGGGIGFVVDQPAGILGGGVPVAAPGDQSEGAEESDLGGVEPVAAGILAAEAEHAFANEMEREGGATGGEIMVDHHFDRGDGATGPALGFGDGVGGIELPGRVHRPEDRGGWRNGGHGEESIEEGRAKTSRTGAARWNSALWRIDFGRMKG